jgi:hypothetical protein
MSFWAKLQTDDGHWADDYGGPMFLLPGLLSIYFLHSCIFSYSCAQFFTSGLVITAYISGTELTKWQKIEMIRYLTNHQNPDGGWGLYEIFFPKMIENYFNRDIFYLNQFFSLNSCFYIQAHRI